ncbi:MAG: mechanosensitive ion channel family protein [Anaerolineaceae bacterium]|jgi:small conductance mechanosensitive channel|nr:mechanosensitive ion channel family protein [Anaerolineaceae bacterium]
MIPFTLPSQMFQDTELTQILLYIFIFFIIAGIIRWLANLISKLFLGLYQLSPRHGNISAERKDTLRGLYASIIRFTAVAVAMIASVALFVKAETLIWVVGLFSAAFGFGARPIISDIMAGLAFMSEDNFSVGDKVEVFSSIGLGGVQGVVESVHLRTTFLRSTSGELYLIPNSEMRIVRNFSRGRFSIVKITLAVSSTDLSRSLVLLEDMREDAVLELPNLLEPWQIISDSGKMGEQTELTLVAKARFGKAGEMRPRLLAVVQRELEKENIALVN